MIELATEHIDDEKYFLFQIGEELYGTPLLGVREVIEVQEVKPIPNTKEYYLGMINIRGEIVGVVDLRLRFGHRATEQSSNALILFNTENGVVATYVDRVDSVVIIPKTAIDRGRKVKTPIQQEDFIGIGMVNDRLVTVVDLNQILSKESISVSTERN